MGFLVKQKIQIKVKYSKFCFVTYDSNETKKMYDSSYSVINNDLANEFTACASK